MAANNLLFHETFQPETTYIAKILELSINGFSGDKFTISELTGIPTGNKKGKVEPHIKYAKYMGLVNYACSRGNYDLSATELGREVWNQDRYLHETLTLWLLHYMISRSNTGAPQWAYVVREINQGFTEDMSSTHMAGLIQKEFGLSSADATKAFGVVKGSYSTGCFSNLFYLTWEDRIQFEEKTVKIELGYLYAYALLNSWDELFPEKKEITFNEVMENIGFGKVFGLNDEDVDSVLSTLEKMGIISLNRQLYPVTIVRISDAESVISNIYSMLM